MTIRDDLTILLTREPTTSATLAAEVAIYPIARGESARAVDVVATEAALNALRSAGTAEYVPGKGWRKPAVEVVKQGSLF